MYLIINCLVDYIIVFYWKDYLDVKSFVDLWFLIIEIWNFTICLKNTNPPIYKLFFQVSNYIFTAPFYPKCGNKFGDAAALYFKNVIICRSL